MQCPYSMTATLLAFVTLAVVALAPVVAQIRTATKTPRKEVSVNL